MRFPIILLTLASILSFSSTQVLADEAEKLHALFDEHYELGLKRQPIMATFQGDHRFNDKFVVEIAPEYIEESLEIARDYKKRVQAIDPDQLSHEDQVNREIFLYQQSAFLEGGDIPGHLIPLNQFFSMPSIMAMLGAGQNIQPFNTAEDYDNFLARMEGFSDWTKQAVKNMREGMEKEVVQPKIVMERVLGQLQAQIVEDPTESTFWNPVRNMPEGIEDEEAERISKAYEKAIAEIMVPAYRRLHDFIESEYIDQARETDGLHGIPGGRDWYAWMARQHTTTDLTPEEIHEIGLEQVGKLHKRIETLIEEIDFDGSMTEFFDYTKEDPRFFAESREELLEVYEALRPAAEEGLDPLFDIRPKAEFEIRKVERFREREQAAASYMPPAPDGSRPGIFYVNTYDLKSRPLWMAEALFVHEAIPGHHFQMALQQEQEGLPAFRRHGMNTAFVEGWGLYAESLGKEMGLYEDPYQYYGMLYMDLWRAIRLVVDTGMHHFGWSREKAIDYMSENSPVGRSDVTAEVERYMVLPGQALAYKIGQLRILELRERAEEQLGEDFDIREFHNLLLTGGSMPLDVLEREVDRWIEART